MSMDDPDCVREAYELIGRIVVAFAHLDRIIIAENWRTKTPSGHWATDASHQYGENLDDWANHHRPAENQAEFTAFVEWAKQLGIRRNEFVHMVAEIRDRDGKAWIAVTRRELKWRKSFEKWAKRFPLPVPNRPAAPSALPEHEAFESSDLADLLSDIVSATEQIKARSAAVRP